MDFIAFCRRILSDDQATVKGSGIEEGKFIVVMISKVCESCGLSVSEGIVVE